MEKNTNMPNADEELCLKYVLNELDPSEIMLVERAMAEDDDILIEVESMRATLRKLNRLPEYAPPEDLQQQILEHAREHAEYRYSASRMINLFSLPASTTYTAAALAAVLIITLSYGVYQYSAELQQNSSLTPEATTEMFAPGTSSQTQSEAAFSYEQPEYKTANAGEENLRPLPANSSAGFRPWTNENRILRLPVRSGQNSSILGNAAAFRSAGSADINLRPFLPLHYNNGSSNNAFSQSSGSYLQEVQFSKSAADLH